MAAQRKGEGNKTRRRKPNKNESAGRIVDTEVKAPNNTDAARLSFSKAETRRRNWLETIDKNRFLTVPCLASEEGLVGLQFLADAASQDWDQLSADGEDNTVDDDSGNNMGFKHDIVRSTQSPAK
jgi:hypothetical protein